MHAIYSGASGGDPAAASSILGHSDISLTTRVYFQPLEEVKRKAVEAVTKIDEDRDAAERYRKKQEMKKQTKPKKRKKFKATDIGFRYDAK